MLNLLAVVLSCCGDGGTVPPGPWAPSSGSSDGGGSCSSCSPIGAQYWTGAADGTLTAEKNLGALSTGLVKNTGGVPSQYAGTSCTNQFPRSLDNSGAATCASVALTTDVSGTLPETSGGTGSGGFTCGSGQAITSNGTAYSCTSTLIASDVSCSGCVSLTSEVSGVTPEANGGTGATALTCSAGQALTSNGTAYSCSSGPFAAGGSSPQVQYNNSGVLGGMTNYGSDGVRPLVIAEANPSTPVSGTLHYDYSPVIPDAGWPMGFPMLRDAFHGIPMPVGLRASGFVVPISTVATWSVHCANPDGWGASTVSASFGTTSNLSVSSSGGTNTVAWDGTTYKGRQRTIGFNAGSAVNGISDVRFAQFTTWRGSAAGAGGFIFWVRTWIMSANGHQGLFVGLVNNTNVFANGTVPSALTDTVYAGNDTGQTTLHICSNDNVGAATCGTDLGANFPTTTSGVGYDIWLAAAPNSSTISYYVERLDSAQQAQGVISSDLPRNTVQLTMHSYLGVMDGGTATRQDFEAMCTWDNW